MLGVKQNKLEKSKFLEAKKSLVTVLTDKNVSQRDGINLNSPSKNLENEMKKLEISQSAPVPPPLPIFLLQEPTKVESVKKPVETKPVVVDQQQALLESIRNFKGFQKKERQQAALFKPDPQDFNNQLKNAIVSRQKFFSKQNQLIKYLIFLI